MAIIEHKKVRFIFIVDI